MSDQIGPYTVGPNPSYWNGIYQGDARWLSLAIPNNSVDMIFCDPVYWQHEDYAWLAELGARVLKDGGHLIAQCGNPDIPALLPLMSSHLEYTRILCEKFPVATQYYMETKCLVGWKPYLWFRKGKREGGWVFDAMMGGGKAKHVHKWGDSPKVFIEWISRLTSPGAIVLDPFTGGGTVPAVCKQLGRKWLAFELDGNAAIAARKRVEETQPPLFATEASQLRLLESEIVAKEKTA